MRWILFLLCLPFVSGLEWSEIMFDPVGSDNGKEFIELLGTEDLSDCIISDSKSSDILTLVREGTDVILIIEEDGVFQTDATIYHAGKAIGNGLGNSYEEITITCEEELLSTTYNFSVEPGYSIVYKNGWVLGSENGTPGTLERVKDVVSEPRTRYCDSTLLITVTNTSGFAAEPYNFTIESAGFASFTVEENNSIILEGNTLSQRSYSVVPETDITITAYASECDARQRAKRIIPVLEKKQEAVVTPVQVNITKPKVPEPLPLVLPEPEPVIVYEEDANLVPWVVGFGIVTLLLSAGLYLYEKKAHG